MRLTTWNVNGIRNPFGYQPWSTVRTFPAMFDILEADIVVMQELKIQRKDLRDDMVILDGWDCYFSLPKQKKGYSGVGIYTRNAVCAPVHAEEGILGVLSPPNSRSSFRDLPEDEHIGGYPTELQIAELGVDPMMLDSEGRCVCLEFPAFVLFGVYSPANSNGLRDDFRYGFLCALDCRIRNLIQMGKRVVLVGDLNVSRCEMDTASAFEDIRKAGLTHEDYISTPNRRIFNHLIIGGEVVGERDEGREQAVLCDIVRDFHPERKGMYTHWEQKVNARPGNFGSRIDFVLASGEMKEWFRDANIQEGLMGSDHCPVFADFKDIVDLSSSSASTSDCSLSDIMNPPGFFKKGERLIEWSVKKIPSTSGKLLPEFDKRRSIKDMFKKPSISRDDSSTQTTPLLPAATIDKSNGAHDDHGENAEADQLIGINDPTTGSPGLQNTAARSSPRPAIDKKRKPSDTPEPRTLKRQKSVNVSLNAKGEPLKGQQSLKGFFAPKVKAVAKVAIDEPDYGTTNGSRTAATEPRSPLKTEDTAANGNEGENVSTALSRPSMNGNPADSATQTWTPTTPDRKTMDNTNPATQYEPSPSAASTDSYIIDPIVSKESWSTLFRKPAAPLCEGHSEPCKSMLTKKKGENQGRSFWMCTRPLGPSGAKERGTQWRCGTFIWCSDFKGEV